MKGKINIRSVGVSVLLCMTLLLPGCGRDGAQPGSTGGRDRVIREEFWDDGDDKDQEAAKRKKAPELPEEEADIDVTVMSRDMVYSTIFQMLADPEKYVGKTVRIEGRYFGDENGDPENARHFCVIRDAQACCAQGMEFVWEDGSHEYPDEYPEEDARIIVQGTFELFREEESGRSYCRLKDCYLSAEEEI